MIDERSLPDHKYVPGETPRHPEGAFDSVRDLALFPTATRTESSNVPWRYGHRLLTEGYYWEAHEVWEPVWLNARPRSAERMMCQTVIQIANAALKRDMNKANAAQRLCELAENLLQETKLGFETTPMGLHPALVSEVIAQIADDTRTGARTKISLI